MKALVVDDDDISRMVLIRLLDGLGLYDVHEAGDGEQAWEMLQAGLRPSVMFCDGRMPHLSGQELLARMTQQNFLPCPVIFVSASEEKETVEQALALGAVDYLVKPFKIEDLRTQLDTRFRHQREQIAENPAVSVKRLQIHMTQLAGYLSAFQTQLDAAMAEFTASMPAEDRQKRLISLEHACATLGLHYAASLLSNAKTANQDHLLACMKIVRKGLLHQMRVVKTLLAASKV